MLPSRNTTTTIKASVNRALSMVEGIVGALQRKNYRTVITRRADELFMRLSTMRRCSREARTLEKSLLRLEVPEVALLMELRTCTHDPSQVFRCATHKMNELTRFMQGLRVGKTALM
jgi:hypothetical protein